MSKFCWRWAPKFVSQLLLIQMDLWRHWKGLYCLWHGESGWSSRFLSAILYVPQSFFPSWLLSGPQTPTFYLNIWKKNVRVFPGVWRQALWVALSPSPWVVFNENSRVRQQQYGFEAAPSCKVSALCTVWIPSPRILALGCGGTSFSSASEHLIASSSGVQDLRSVDTSKCLGVIALRTWSLSQDLCGAVRFFNFH